MTGLFILLWKHGAHSGSTFQHDPFVTNLVGTVRWRSSWPRMNFYFSSVISPDSVFPRCCSTQRKITLKFQLHVIFIFPSPLRWTASGTNRFGKNRNRNGNKCPKHLFTAVRIFKLKRLLYLYLPFGRGQKTARQREPTTGPVCPY